MVCVLDILLYELGSMVLGNSGYLPKKEYMGVIWDQSEN